MAKPLILVLKEKVMKNKNGIIYEITAKGGKYE